MEKIKIQIKNRWSGHVLFEYEKEHNTLKDTVVEAVKRSACLRNADLRGAILVGADLRGAYLGGACLKSANLNGACLRNADLKDANLRDAILLGADLGGAELICADMANANLEGVYLGDADLSFAFFDEWGQLQDILNIGPIGSRKAYTTFYKTDKGIFVRCGCFSGTLDEFVAKVKQKHQGNINERDYLALVEFVKVKFQ